ncbi:FMN-dependent NADH-azoreductase [Rhizobium sp. VS19-DR104.2]|uniref:FMN-dependent NADH-azoreductase n=1 Tax=unclassified Rhizobium TaxID=2613769 RepID=UPI001CC5DBFA|nr:MULTISPECIES: FMN-dependent NADH-azoreductase [unclassified Rhizobium]MBZ5763281.1 FMN-dependent NADH-azoreductase [Rhizobium sp. VS19-DR96]MBZ5769682.1 FMN-dependent NADH-azoreductase [Rhizobium sp. VS19-DR129.2]MBZ5777215.1 FMN-dependent NADH-azoreductase [Rhizobium sp. VS19-DRK62.2]MBZ5787848.1 FMN-dependent NADH-azoreductase [Rhizobium sp. VS19-DR121]MBZ5805339.1 FMN-dependent NADH-azoreductase [Rhizobium sp. VS19-DR181]
MTTILHIDSSILGGYSVSRTLTAEIVAKQEALHPDARVIRRDLVVDAAMHLSDAHLAVFQGGEIGNPALGQDLATGGAYIDDLFAADIIVIGAPMYNFTIPTQLKGWIDRVCVAGRTFQYGANGPEGLVKGKKVFLASARGGVYSAGSPAAGLDHQETYLRGVLGFIGLTDVTIIRAEGLALGEDAKAAAISAAKAQIEALAA